MKENTIAKAVAFAIGSTLSVGVISDASAAATTMYNLTTKEGIDFSGNTTACAPCNGGTGSDGWVWGYKAANELGTDASVASWAGTDGPYTTPFGYTSNAALHWALHMTSNGTAEISSQDSLTRYGIGADIDTAQGAWSDNALSGAGGWRHDLDFGLFKSDVGGQITLKAQGINQLLTNFGFTIIKGVDGNTDPDLAYNHHGAWNASNNTQIGAPTSASLPGGNTIFSKADIVAFSIGGATPSNLNTITFHADPDQIYTIILGGYRNGEWGKTYDGYKLEVNAVPLPASVWLFGSAMAGLIGFGRRLNKSAA